MSIDLKSLTPDEARQRSYRGMDAVQKFHMPHSTGWLDALEYASAHGYVPPAPPKPDIRLWDRVKCGEREGVLIHWLSESYATVQWDGDPIVSTLHKSNLSFVARPTWAPVEQSDR